MTLNAYQLPPPNEWQSFERFARDLFAAVWQDERAQSNGRAGQAQAGVDVFGQNTSTSLLEGVQCKGKDGRYGNAVTVDELRGEVNKAKTFTPAISHYYLVTSGPADVAVQTEARAISDAHKAAGSFGVTVYGWEQLLTLLDEHKRVARRHFGALHRALSDIDEPAVLIAICQQSFQATENLFHEVDPVAAADGFYPVLLDATSHFQDGVLDIRAAIRGQRDLFRDISRRLKEHPEATVAYIGIAHIPLIMHAGTAASTKTGVRLYEKEAATGEWVPLLEGLGPDLGVRLEDCGGLLGAEHAVVTVEVSASVSLSEVQQTLPQPFRHFAVRIAQPKRGAVTHQEQATQLAHAFREALDKIHNENPRAVRHVFAAAPVSVAFRLGQMVSQTMHRSVLAYNYSQRSDPPYHWAVDLVAPDGAPNQIWTWEGNKNV
jgi:SMODS-associated and fused to various effectors sensor domain